MNKKNKKYEAPKVEVMIVTVEKGFQGSGNDNGGISAPSWGII